MAIFSYWLANFLKFNSWLQWTSISWFCHNTKSGYYTPYFTDERTVQEDYFAPDYRQQVKKPGETKILTIIWECWVFRSGFLEGCELPAWLRYGFLFMVTWKIHTLILKLFANSPSLTSARAVYQWAKYGQTRDSLTCQSFGKGS